MRYALAALVASLATGALAQPSPDPCPSLSALRPGMELVMDVEVISDPPPNRTATIAMIENGPGRRVMEMRMPPLSITRMEGRPPASGIGPFFPERVTTLDPSGRRPPNVVINAINDDADHLAERILAGPTTYTFVSSSRPAPITASTVPRRPEPLQIGPCTFATVRWSAGWTSGDITMTTDMVQVPTLGISFPEMMSQTMGTRSYASRYRPTAIRLAPAGPQR